MVSKIIDYLVWTVVTVCLFGVLWLIIEPIIWWTEYSEIRLCVRLFLITFAVNTFGVLRLYNSIVQNTRFSIKLREAILKFVGSVPGLERVMKNLNGTLGNVRSSVDTLRKEISNNTESIGKLIEKNKLNNLKR